MASTRTSCCSLWDAAPAHFYPVGVAGKPWGDAERAQWLANQTSIQRSYQEEVLDKLEELKEQFDVEQFGALTLDPKRYPLFVVKTRNWDEGKPSLFITGGTHGYETSGVQGALLFARTDMAKYAGIFNIAVVPCVSPWSYECIQRWNPSTVDPNRSYVPDSPSEECAAVLRLLTSLKVPHWMAHWDLHETTDTDLEEFMPAKASRDGLPLEDDVIPDGFYLMGCTEAPQDEWHKAMIDAVRKVTHIAPGDADGKILGLPLSQEGVVNSNPVGKGKGATGQVCDQNAKYATTTEAVLTTATRLLTPTWTLTFTLPLFFRSILTASRRL